MIIFVGDKPSPRMKPGARPFEGSNCEDRLHRWIYTLIGMLDESITKWDIINQCDYAHVNFVAMTLRDGCKLVALGNNASKALGSIPHFKLPHPSGKNRQVNNKKFIDKKLSECREWLKEQR